jgi:hypothetical protein
MITLYRKIIKTWYSLLSNKKASKNFSGKPMDKIFTDIHRKGYWKKSNSDSVSGIGSNLNKTTTLLKELHVLIDNYKIKTMLDLPCGDFNWMKHNDFNLDNYIGADIVSKLIIQNNKLYRNEKRKFKKMDLTKSNLPKVDVILCRDCLVHFSYDDIKKAVNNIIKSESKYFLTTTFTGNKQNYDIITGAWRPINLELEPFNFPEPITYINENCQEFLGLSKDKSLGLWSVESLRNCMI